MFLNLYVIISKKYGDIMTVNEALEKLDKSSFRSSFYLTFLGEEIY